MKEKQIQNAILDWLAWNKIFAWQNDTTGIYDPVRCKFRANKRKMRGVADILCVHKGSAIAIEVKTEKGKLSKHQQIFNENFTKAGGFYVLARGVDDVAMFFKWLGEKK